MGERKVPMKTQLTSSAVIAWALLEPGRAFADPPATRTLSVLGIGRVSAVPDMALTTTGLVRSKQRPAGRWIARRDPCKGCLPLPGKQGIAKRELQA